MFKHVLTIKSLALVAALGAGLAMTSPAHAETRVSVGFGVNVGAPVYAAPSRVYYAPAPVYVTPVYAPAPVYYPAPQPTYCPPPVVYQQATPAPTVVYVQAPPPTVVYQPAPVYYEAPVYRTYYSEPTVNFGLGFNFGGGRGGEWHDGGGHGGHR